MIVLDASVTLAWFFEDERSPPVNAILTSVTEGGAIVPAHWHLEVANGMRMAIRRGRMDASLRSPALERLSRMRIIVDGETQRHAWHAIVTISDRFALTPYDAAYLELAQRLRLPLATLDAQLKTAAESVAVEIA